MPSRGFLAKLTVRRLKRGCLPIRRRLKATINRFIADTNADPKPLVWTADPTVLAAVKRGKQALESDLLHIGQQFAGWSSSALQGQNKCRT